MEKASNHFIVILCGGSGPRLWPLSRADHPKQFLKINNQFSLLQLTVKRCLKIIPKDNLFVISNEKYLNTLKLQIDKLIPLKNIITEPEKKNTTAAIIYSTVLINQICSNPTITTLPSDHFISKLDQFKKNIRQAATLAQNSNNLVTIGIKPTFPNPSYGYILPKSKFIEKPDTNTAQNLIKQGALWNSGIYTYTYKTLFSELSIHQKEIFNLSKLVSNHPENITFVKKFYHQIPSISIDNAISEKTKHLSTIKANFNWSDIGEWKTIYKHLAKNSHQNVILDPATSYVEHNSRGCLVSSNSGKFIGLVGVEDLAIIDTPDCLLVCKLSDSYEVRNLVSKIVKKKNIQNYFLKSNDLQ